MLQSLSKVGAVRLTIPQAAFVMLVLAAMIYGSAFALTLIGIPYWASLSAVWVLGVVGFVRHCGTTTGEPSP